jgi:hypothetical protein
MTCGGISASSGQGFFESRENTELRSGREYSGSCCIEARRSQRACLRGSDWMAFRRSFGRAFGVLILALTPWILLAIGVHAQAPPNLPPPGAYQSIPNFAGVGAGLQFRQAINDRVSGIQPIAPAIVRLAFANLPTEQDGRLIYCTNCTKTIPCAGGGSGAWAMGQNGQWTCGAAGLSPTTDINFNAHKATNLAGGTVNGDALAFGQLGSQLGAYIQPSVVGISTVLTDPTSVTLNKPNGTVSGDLLVFAVGVQSATLVVTPPVSPGTWTLVRTDSTSSFSQAIYQKVAGGGEPSSYTFTLSTGTGGEAAIVTIANQNSSTPIDGTSSGTTNSNVSSVTITAPTTTSPRDLNLVFFVNSAGPHTLTSPGGGKPFVDMISGDGSGLGGFYYSSPTTSATVTGSDGGGNWTAVQVAILSTTVTGTPAIRDATMGFSSSVATNTPNYSGAANPMTGYSVDGMFNVIAYGADPTGLNDNSAAFTAAYSAACAVNNGTVWIPGGTYNFLAPWLAMCPSSTSFQQPDIVGAGRSAAVLLNHIGSAVAIGGGPLLELAHKSVLSSFGGASTLISAGLTAGGGNSFNWGPSGTPPNALFNLDQIFGDRALNGKAQLDLRVIFNTTTNSANEYLISSDGSATPIADGCNAFGPNGSWTCKGGASISLGSDGKLYGSINTSVTGWTGPSSLHSSSAVGTGTSLMAELSYDGSNVRLFHGALGGTSTMDAKVAQTGSIVQRIDENLVLGAMSQFWDMVGPANFWQGKMDSVQISNTARCTSDGGCSIPNAKLAGDSNTIFLENWTNVSKLPLVEPEYTNEQATDHNTKQSWMAMYNLGLGNSGGDYPVLRDFDIEGGMVGIHVNDVSAQLEGVDMLPIGPNYGIMLDQAADYSSTIDDTQMQDNVLPISIVGGLSYLTRLSITCGVSCMELVGTSVRDALLLPGSLTQWGIILSGPTHIDSVVFDTEGGGTFTGIQISNMGGSGSASLELSSSSINPSGSGVAPITIDGVYGSISSKNTQLVHGSGTGPMVDASHARQNSANTTGIDFENDLYDLRPEPSDTAGDSYVSPTDNLGNPVVWTVVGGSTTRQTTLTGTSAGTFVWSMPGEGSSYKRFVGHYTGYENTTATAQTITYPVAFTNTPKITSNDGPSGSASTTALTLPASMGSAATGWIIVEGY